MASKKVIVVFGATGAQGGSAAKFLLKDGTFEVRGVTRDVNSPAAQELAKQGAKLVSADLEDRASLVKALTGAYGVFGVTNFWDPKVLFEGEVRQGKLLADVAKEVGVQHFVWSNLDHGKCPHFESKAQVADYIASINLPNTNLLTSFYYENFYNFGMTIKNADGSITLANPIIPDAKFPVYAVEDNGAWVLQIFLHPDKYLGKNVQAVAEIITMNEIASVFEKMTGKKTGTLGLDRKGMEEYGKQGWMQQELIYNNLEFVDHPNMRNVEESKKVYPAAQGWEAFLRGHLNKFNL